MITLQTVRLMASLAVLATLAPAAPLWAAGKGQDHASQTDVMQVGAARVEITPADLTGLNPMTGKAFDKVHDPIFARLIVLSKGKQTAVLVSIDAIEVGDMDQPRQRISRETGIPADHIMITATHDHNAPRLGNVTPGALAHPPAPEVTPYTDSVIGKIIAGIKTARTHARPAEYGIGKGSADINVNRDEYTPKGWKIGFNPAGPSDKTVTVVRFADMTGKTIAAIVNYPVHANVMLGANQLSGDLTGAVTRYLENGMGGDAVAVYTQSAIGDQAPRVFTGGPKDSEPTIAAAWQEAEAQGLMLGAEALRILGHIDTMRTAHSLDAADSRFDCPTRHGTDQMADMHQQNVNSVPIRLSMIRFDDVALGGVSGEVLTNIYRHLKAESPLSDTLLISLTNDRVGYLPEDSAYDRPTFEVKGSPVQRGCAEDGIVDGLIGLIGKLDH